MKKLTKKQTLAIVEDQWGDITSDDFIKSLCETIPVPLEDDWCNYWDKINTTDIGYISSIFQGRDDYETLSTLTRLLIVHNFIEDTYK